MQQYRKKPVVIEAITFDELVQHGLNNCGAHKVNNMPWSFDYKGHPITHETDECYLIPTLEGTMKFTKGDMLITGIQGEIYPCKADIFATTYEPVSAPSDDDRDLIARLKQTASNLRKQADTLKALSDAFYPVPATAPVQSAEVVKIWEGFWKGIVCNEDGSVNIEQVKKELADFSFVLEQLPKVYCHITGGRMSNVMYKAEDVIRASDDHQQELFEEWKKDEEEAAQSAGMQWVKTENELPGHAKSVLTEDFAGHYKMMEYNGPADWWKRNVKRWLRESSSPSTVKEQDSEWKEQLQLAAHEREVLVKAFDKVRRLFELRSWIMEGRGSYPYNDDRYKEEVRYLYDEFDALVKDTWANIKTKSFEYQKWIIEEYLKENSSKEQETAIAFAKWMDHKGCWRNPMTTLYYLYGDNKGKDLPELYDLFIKSTTNGE